MPQEELDRLIAEKLRTFPFRRTELIIEQYKIGKLIGQGAHSKVYVAEHARTAKLYAIKIFEKRLQSDKKYAEKYRHEILMARDLEDCPYTLDVYEYFEDEERIYAVQQYCRGGDLLTEINRRKKEHRGHFTQK